MTNYENAVFVSYAWGGESEQIVDKLEHAFQIHGIRITRDKKDLDYKGLIEAFEQRIGRGQCIVLVINDKYLRSEHCMYELLEVNRNRNLCDRIFPIVLADAHIYQAAGRLEYIKYWDDRIEELNRDIKGVRVMSNLSNITADLDKYSSIRTSFDYLTDLLSDMNALTPQVHAASGFSTLIDAVKHAMPEREARPERPGKTVPPSNQVETKRVELIPAGPQTSSIEFVNRAEELRQLDLELLRASDLSPFTQIHAPAGYGKSYLLQKLIKEAQNNVELNSKWSICYIDFSEDVDNQRQLFQDRITGTLQQNFSVEQLCDHVINNLAGPYSNGRRAVLLVLDSIEELDLESETYLIEFFFELFNRIHPSPNREIITTRVILSGRKVDEFWGKYEKRAKVLLAPNKVALTPFKDYAIEQLVARQANNLKIPLSTTDIKQIAFEVQYLSGGHPKIIRGLVDRLARRSFAIGSPKDYFSTQRAALVENQVSPVANALLENLVDELKKTICVLSTFRRLTANTISALISAGLLPTEIQGIDLLEQLSKAHLLDSPKFDDPFYRDHLMQRVLALKMAHSIDCQASYMECNKVALELYKKLILQPPSSAASANPDDYLIKMQLPYFFVEWLYHALQDPQLTDEDLRKRFDELASCLLGISRSQDSIKALKEQIEQDFEIVYLARDRFGEGGISIISNWLNQP